MSLFFQIVITELLAFPHTVNQKKNVFTVLNFFAFKIIWK